ncbi:MAG: 50S ribosomal protein L18 [Candidatus Omnitrophica bacterium]|nr:50S ribosomal protein L18 [Candidatus Omnitrophota bacterium]
MAHVKGRIRRHFSIRKKIMGTKEKPRLSINRSVNNITAQLIDDIKGHTLFALTTNSKAFKGKAKSWGNVAGASAFGDIFAEEAVKKGFSKVVFDRGGYLYHGRIKAFADIENK